ncbi:MAG TPA: ATP-binding cassette domain-containing protein [Pseudonocardiaceae bacterium]|jgi:ABC-type bacteriocin/lantibiotic exporter with double-glycine peptidase domain|nr:ATP-binding cassette domain-containing protein [Pseudonocardiaceae bacterium]
MTAPTIADKRDAEKRYVRTPITPQMESADCGAACLASVLAAHGRRVELAEVRRAIGIGRDGASVAALGRAATGYGLRPAARMLHFAKDADVRAIATALRPVPMPAIAFADQSHFVVLEGIRRGTVRINDPAIGHIALSATEFARRCGGALMVLRRTPEFTSGGRRWPVLRVLLDRARPYLPPLGVAVLLGVFAAAPTVLTALLSRALVIRVLGARELSLVPLLLIGLGAAALGAAGTVYVQRSLISRVLSAMARHTSADYLWRMLRLPGTFVHRRNPATLAFRVQLNDGIAVLVADRLTSGIAATAVLGIDLVALSFIALPLAGIALLVAAAQLLTLQLVAKVRAAEFSRSLSEQMQRDTTAHAGLTMIESLKAEAAEGWFFARWAQNQADALHADQRMAARTQLTMSIPSAIASLGSTSVMLLGVLLLQHGVLDYGTVVAAQTLLGALLVPVSTLVGVGSDLQQAQAQVSVLADVDGERPDPRFEPIGPSEEPAARLTGRLELRNVEFRYDPNAPLALSGVSFTVEPGQRCSIVGATGSGKSTLARLLVGAADPTGGQILLDGVPRGELPRPVLVGSVSYVEQQARLLDGTVADNLSGWDNHFPRERLRAALADAEIARLVDDRGGLDQDWLGDQGRTLSGGEKQRLEIARALATDPAVLIMDEATSALDAEVERQIDANLRARGCTTVVIAHRLSTVRDSDLIIVLDGGRIAGRGTHEQLLVSNATYRGFVEEA